MTSGRPTSVGFAERGFACSAAGARAMQAGHVTSRHSMAVGHGVPLAPHVVGPGTFRAWWMMVAELVAPGSVVLIPSF